MDGDQQTGPEGRATMNDEPSGTGSSSDTAPVQSPSGVPFPDNDLHNTNSERVGVVEPTATNSGDHGDPNDPVNPSDRSVASSAGPHVQEISQQNIKNRLNEVITEIEREVERELDSEDREDREGFGREERTEERTRSGAQETVNSPTAGSPANPESANQSGRAMGGQGEVDDQWQPEPVDFNQLMSSGVVSEQNSNPEAMDNRQPMLKDLHDMPITKDNATFDAASFAVHDPIGMVSVQAQTEPVAYTARGGRFASPYGTTATSSLPRGWPGGGGVAFALSGQPVPPAISHEVPKQQWSAPPRPHDTWKAREAAASPYATLPRTDNVLARGWENNTKTDHQKRVHFADTPQVQMFEDDAVQRQEANIQIQTEVERGPKPASAPAASQMFTIPNMAARPYGRTSPLVVAPVKRESPSPMFGGGQMEVDACVRNEQNENQEMSSQPPEPEPEPVAPPAPPVQKTPVPASKIFTPAQDNPVMPQKKKTMFVDSAFFSPKVHPTWEQQVEMAKRISSSLSDASNKQSKGQSMYERRKKRSAKWVHGGSQEVEEGVESPHVPKDKPLLQLLMNPHGHVYDLNALKKQGWIIDSKGGLSPEICSDLIKDLNSPTGKGAQIFAKRKKRAEKWVVDEEHRETRRADESQVDSAQQRQSRAPQVPHQPAAAPQLTPAAPKAPQPALAFQQSPVQLQPVPLQTLYQAPAAPQFPSGGVYAPRTAHSWSAAQQQTENKKSKSTSSKTFDEITQNHPTKNVTSSSELHTAHISSSQSTITESSQMKTSQQTRLTRAMQHEENKENISTSQALQSMDMMDMTQQDVELKMAEAVFEETARQMEISSGDQSRLSLGSGDVTSEPTGVTSDPAGMTSDDPTPDDHMEIDPDVSPQLARLKTIDKPSDWAEGATELVKPTTIPVAKPTAESAVALPALKPISKPADWSGPQESVKPSEGVPKEEPRPLVALKPISLPPVEEPMDKAFEEPKPLVSLKPVVRPTDHASNKPTNEEPKPLVSLKPVPKSQAERPPNEPSGEESSSPFGVRLTTSRPAGGLRQSQLVEAVTSEVPEEVSGVWGRVSAIRDTFDSGSRSGTGSRSHVQVEKPRAPTMAVPNAFHQMPNADAEPKSAMAVPDAGKDLEDACAPAMQQTQTPDYHLTAWGDEDEQEFMEPAEFSSGQSAGLTECFGQSGVMSDNRSQSYQAREDVYQSHSALTSSEFKRSATDVSSGSQQPISAPLADERPISRPDGSTDDVMFQCEVAMVETTVNQEALQDYLGGSKDREWLRATDHEPRPSSAPPVAQPALPSAAPAVADHQPESSQAEAAARAAILAERQRNRLSWTNYNTAARGWGNKDHFYRPVTFTQPPLVSQ